MQIVKSGANLRLVIGIARSLGFAIEPRRRTDDLCFRHRLIVGVIVQSLGRKCANRALTVAVNRVAALTAAQV